ncbi:hypothetical protein M3Y98_01207800 [Aphelenchoides besseyi]|nr:hypothetical protein M3Y98_01207800 [Aphelenchoides besseyi]
MDFVIFDRERFHHLYNCSFYDVDVIPPEKRRHLVLGFLCIFLFLALYLPCLWAISRLQIERTVSKLMFLLGLSDTCGLIGICWGVGSLTNVLLALNRCIQIHNSGWAQVIFNDKKFTRIWLPLILLYGFIGMVGSKPIFFSSIYMIGFFNPHQGYFEDTEKVYHNYLHTLNNFFVVVGIVSMYVFFFVGLAIRRRMRLNGTTIGPVRRIQRHEISTFCQILIIALLEVSTCLIYIYIQFFKSTQLVYYVGTFTFLFRQGSPSIIYLVANKRIRNILRRALGFPINRIKGQTTLHSASVEARFGTQSTVRPIQNFH